MIKDKITEEKLEKYFKITNEALEIIKKSIIFGREEDAKEIIEMVSNYLSDANHFKKENDWVLAFGALNYAYGWIDSGVRLNVFDVKDNVRFTIK